LDVGSGGSLCLLWYPDHVYNMEPEKRATERWYDGDDEVLEALFVGIQTVPEGNGCTGHD
jgi:hypothetical protein